MKDISDLACSFVSGGLDKHYLWAAEGAGLGLVGSLIFVLDLSEGQVFRYPHSLLYITGAVWLGASVGAVMGTLAEQQTLLDAQDMELPFDIPTVS